MKNNFYTKMKAVLTLALAFLMIASLLAGVVKESEVLSAEGEIPFTDVAEDSWYYYYVKGAYKSGIMSGKPGNKFDPTADMTRAEFVTVLCRLSGDDCTGMGGTLTFTDVPKDAWYADCLGWGTETGTVKGLPENKFAPEQPVTRQEMAVFVERLFTYLGITLQNNSETVPFKDAGKVSGFAKTSVELMQQNDIILGDPDGNFNPESNSSRAEIATIVSRVINNIEIWRIKNRFNPQKEFLFSDDNEDIPFPYRLYLPEDYSEDKEYPLLVYLHGNTAQGTDNVIHLGNVGNYFDNPDSPAYDSIVLVPQCPPDEWWHGATIDGLAELLDYINGKYSTDLSRQYITGISMGGDGTWQMLMQYPEKVSAAIPVAGTGITFMDNGTEEWIPVGINDEMLEIPIYMVYDNDDGFSDGEYNRKVYQALMDNGATNLFFKETNGLGHGICGYYVTQDDISLLEWLFAQRRETH